MSKRVAEPSRFHEGNGAVEIRTHRAYLVTFFIGRDGTRRTGCPLLIEQVHEVTQEPYFLGVLLHLYREITRNGVNTVSRAACVSLKEEPRIHVHARNFMHDLSNVLCGLQYRCFSLPTGIIRLFYVISW